MMMESKTMTFELWLREYGSHLEQLAQAENRTAPLQEPARGTAASAGDSYDPAYGH
jgi:hypothetical protein